MNKPSVYRHLKTGNLYVVERQPILNATNAQSGQRMVLYRRHGAEAAGGNWFVREENEFSAKFEAVPE